MAEWRFQRSWSAEELDQRLSQLDALELNFDPDEEQSRERGWNLVHSRALIAYDAIGPPKEGDSFRQLWDAIERFEHSDPRIVVAHFGRTGARRTRLLLELKAMGLRYLCPAEVVGARERDRSGTTSRGLAIDTLEGHLERGREWFLLEKEHASGEIRFRIEATWQPGDFPNRWSRLGFHLVARRYQRAWHRLAHLRLRHLAAGMQRDRPARERRPGHEGRGLPAAPVQFYAQRRFGNRRHFIDGDEEED